MPSRVSWLGDDGIARHCIVHAPRGAWLEVPAEDADVWIEIAWRIE